MRLRIFSLKDDTVKDKQHPKSFVLGTSDPEVKLKNNCRYNLVRYVEGYEFNIFT